jgi:hypothetical protein
MLRLLTDEDFNDPIIRGLRRRQPDLDLVRVQDVGLRTLDDETILAWAAQERRVVVTHDRSTLIGFAYDRVRAGLPMPGVIEVSKAISIGRAIEDILLIAICVSEQEIDSQVFYVPQH